MLSVQNLSLKTDRQTLVAGLDFTVRPGECWVVLGRNGAGKTTLLRTLAGLRKPDAGGIQLDGRPLESWRPVLLAKARAYMPQARHDAFAYSVSETVLAARYPYRSALFGENEKDMKAAACAMEQMGVDALSDRDIRRLSGGERQRVALAAVLAQETPLLLLDEPVSALDLAHQVGFIRLLKALCTEQDKSAVLVLHDLNLASETATHMLLLKDGGAWQAGPVAEVMSEEAIAACLGHPVRKLLHDGRPVFLPA